ncbi:glycosyltransferase family 2 protein [Parabacteroides goldsteinii]|uniref:glycosyltransferase family 2 protein n=1 Tax=Parabacteroides goldsteinii TaxID=328812 RepID=UPI00241FEC1C|nr:glycosyltransferase family 2 protein [Parabacteroides goldsteinii]
MINYTIIIPHYRSINTLRRLLLSIPDRDDIQILVIDDNSNLDKEEFKRLPLFVFAKFSMIFLSENRGAGGARNEGLKIAKGKWLIFADSDDFFLPSAFELCDEYLYSKYDIVYLGIRSVDSDTEKAVDRYKVYNRYIEEYDDSSDRTKDNIRFRHDVPWGKMIRSILVFSNHIVFDETRYCNDTMFSTKVALCAKNIHVNIQPFYCVTEKTGSLITQKSMEAFLIRYEVILRKNQLLRESGKKEYQYSILPFLKRLFPYGIVPVLKAVNLGLRYRANFFIGMSNLFKRNV